MSRLIDADALLEKYNVKGTDIAECLTDSKMSRAFEKYCIIADAVEQAESVDAVEVVHGEWEKAKPHGVVIYSNAYAECSSCHSVIYLGWEMKYCPNCGADMRGEANETSLHSCD